MSASKAVEKEGGESSDSEAYVSADEGLGSSRGLQKDAPASGGCVACYVCDCSEHLSFRVGLAY